MARKHDQSLFDSSTMTFGEHLDELRGALIKSVLALVVGTAIGFGVAQYGINLIQTPLVHALEGFYSNQAVEQYTNWANDRKAEGKPAPYTPEEVGQLVTNYELLCQINYVHPWQVEQELASEGEAPPTTAPEATGASAAAKTLAPTNFVPVLVWRPIADDGRIRPRSFGVTEGFFVYMKVAIVFGIILAAPFVFYFVWSFVAAGLYPHEKRYVHIFLPFSIALFLAGVSLTFVFVFDATLSFLLSFNAWLGFDLEPRINEWLGFVLILPLAFGFSFQLPLVMFFLERIGIFSVQTYLANWRVAVLVIVILSAIITPSVDPWTLMLLAGPLWALYFGGVAMCWLMPRAAEPFGE